MPYLISSLDAALSQAKRGHTGFTVVKRFNAPYGCSIQSLDPEHDPAVSGKPQLKKTVSQSADCFID